jgi:hypothetical protein
LIPFQKWVSAENYPTSGQTKFNHFLSNPK